MKLIITDIDGVISFDGRTLESRCVEVLRQICHNTASVVAISSSRRTHDVGIYWIADAFEDQGITVVGQTDDLPIARDMHSDRVDEVVHFVRRFNPEHWITIDDLPLATLVNSERTGISVSQLAAHHLQTSFLTGLEPHHLFEAELMLSRPRLFP